MLSLLLNVINIALLTYVTFFNYITHGVYIKFKTADVLYVNASCVSAVYFAVCSQLTMQTIFCSLLKKSGFNQTHGLLQSVFYSF